MKAAIDLHRANELIAAAKKLKAVMENQKHFAEAISASMSITLVKNKFFDEFAESLVNELEHQREVANAN